MAEKLCALRKKGGKAPQYTETSLWTNPSPSADFAAQTVSLSEGMSNFKYLAVKFKALKGQTDSDAIRTVVSVEDLGKIGTTASVPNVRLGGTNSAGTASYSRSFYKASDTTITFNAALGHNTQATANSVAIPLEILGINELDHGKWFDETTLWTNSAPTTAYTGGTVSLSEDIDNFDFLKITYRFNVSVSTENEIYIPISLFKLSVQSTSTNHNICTLGLQDSSNNFYVRNVFYASDTSVTFTTCYKENGSGNTGNGAIPLTIVGCKFV